jgi:uncharacterized membrane protein
MAEQTSSRRRSLLRTGRLEAFSDGVFAIAITLLVLEIDVPEGSGDNLAEALAEEWPSYLAYAISFGTIGAVWLKHAMVTEYVERANPIFVRLNLLLLLVIAFLPFPTRLIAEYIADDEPGRIATTCYGLTLFLASLTTSALWRYAVRASLLRPEVPESTVRALTTWLTPGLVGYLVMIGLGLFLPVIAVFGYFALAVYLIIPVERVQRHYHREDGGPT